MAVDELLLHLMVSRIPFLSLQNKVRLLEMLDSPEKILRLSRPELEAAAGCRVGANSWKPDRLLRQALEERGHLTAGGIGCTFYADSSYPPLLRELTDPPVLLYYRGRLPDWRRKTVAVVGTRKPTGQARRAAYRLGRGLSVLGVITVSGLALGIDSEAHRGSLDGGGTTVAVLGCGVDIFYPPSGAALARRILTGEGALLSEYPPGTPPLADHFPARNRIISGICSAAVIVEAPRRSGALITADFALEQNRDVYVHAAGLESRAGQGTRGLEEEGAGVITGARDLAAEWGWAVPEGLGCEPAEGREPGGTREAGRRLARLMELELERHGGRAAPAAQTCGMKRKA